MNLDNNISKHFFSADVEALKKCVQSSDQPQLAEELKKCLQGLDQPQMVEDHNKDMNCKQQCAKTCPPTANFQACMTSCIQNCKVCRLLKMKLQFPKSNSNIFLDLMYYVRFLVNFKKMLSLYQS